MLIQCMSIFMYLLPEIIHEALVLIKGNTLMFFLVICMFLVFTYRLKKSEWFDIIMIICPYNHL